MTSTYRFDGGRLARSFISLIPLAAFPLVLHLTGHSDGGLFIVFGVLALGFFGAVLFTALRFRLSVDEQGLVCRGRLRSRRVEFAQVQAAHIRRGRDKATRFMGPPPFRELVLETEERSLVISSLPLGDDAFDELLTTLADRLPESVLDAPSARNERS